MQIIDASGAAAHLGRPFVFLRIEFPNQTAIGPFRIGVLEALHQRKSIGAAAKARGLSYRQTWIVMRYLNSIFDKPLVVTAKGRGGGVKLTRTGLRILSLFRASERLTNSAIARQVKELQKFRLGGS
jgi:molybdate transport system regulatory protein